MNQEIQANEQDARMWGMFLHLSQLTNFVLPILGIVAPIVIWQLNKDSMANMDAHGKNVANWMISAFIYSVICVPLMFILVGIPLLVVLGILTIVFPIIGGIKANNGEVWKYPLAYEFIK